MGYIKLVKGYWCNATFAPVSKVLQIPYIYQINSFYTIIDFIYMNIQQLEYIVAVDQERHFQKAANACNISQPTLSMMIQKLEEELEIKIFDRRKKPIIVTEEGEKVLELARSILHTVKQLKEVSAAQAEELVANLHIGIIPTLAPYLLPLFINTFSSAYPSVKLKITEMTTERIIDQLKNSTIDVGIMATPLHEKSIREEVLFYERFLVYNSASYKKKYVSTDDIEYDKLWLLEEGHCFRSQIINLCQLQKQVDKQLEYQAGSFETLKRLVDIQQGLTILPELATLSLSSTEKNYLTEFKAPAPTREISLCTHRDYINKRVIDALKKSILSSLPGSVLTTQGKNRIEILN